MYGYVAGDDVAVVALHAESIEDAIYGLFVVTHVEEYAFCLFVWLFLSNHVAFKGGHLGLVEQHGVRSAPHIEEIVSGIFLLLRVRVVLESRAQKHTRIVHQFLATVFLSVVEFYLLQGSVRIYGYGSVEEQVVVIDGVHATVCQDGAHVALQFLTVYERRVQVLQDVFLFGCQLVWVFGIDGGEVAGSHLVLHTVHFHGSVLIIDFFQQFAVLHIPVRVLLEEGGFHLELNDADGFVHTGHTEFFPFIEVFARRTGLGQELRTGVVAVCVERKGEQRQEVDAIAVL